MRARDGTTPRPATARSIALSAAAASLVSSVFSLVPAVSSAVTSTAGRVLARLRGDEFVAFSAATNVSYMLFSFYALLLAGQARSGSAAFMQSFLLDDTVLHVAGVALASAGISAVACLYVSRQKLAAGRPVRLVGLVFLVFSNLLFAGAYGLLVFLTAASISVLARRLGVPLVATTSSLAFPTALALLRLI
ncbi:hypothetical protein HYS54_01305 [Candidatus Micrarchaeota archaeon]|nr:hypothetical protein [Candidatus Micrarchaeota archaeon]